MPDTMPGDSALPLPDVATIAAIGSVVPAETL